MSREPWMNALTLRAALEAFDTSGAAVAAVHADIRITLRIDVDALAAPCGSLCVHHHGCPTGSLCRGPGETHPVA